MAFTILLSSAPMTEIKFVEWLFEGSGFSQKARFPSPGETISLPVEPAAEKFRLTAMPRREKPFHFNGLGSNDSLSLIYLPQQVILGSVFHASFDAECRVECPDGKSSQTCITCKIGPLTVRICC
jgi:hypothetical protein